MRAWLSFALMSTVWASSGCSDTATPAGHASTSAAHAGASVSTRPGIASPAPSAAPVRTRPASTEHGEAQSGPRSAVEVPARFHGIYAEAAERCVPGDESGLQVESDRLVFHESAGPLVQAAAEGDVLRVVVRLTGEGETRDVRYVFRLEGGGQTLVDATTLFRRTRCR